MSRVPPLAAPRRAWAAALCLLLVACRSQPVGAPGPTAAAAGEIGGAIRRESAAYHVDAAQSDVRILVRRAGRLASFGHNHVISVSEIGGTLYLHPQLERSAFELSVPVTALIVDDPRLRGEEGEEFAGDIGPDDVEGTRDNMLGPRLLDAERFPTVAISGTLRPALDALHADAVLLVKQHPVHVSVPVTIESSEDSLVASGEFVLTHAQLGLEPFSILLGAIRVADEIEIRFRLVGGRGESAPSGGATDG